MACRIVSPGLGLAALLAAAPLHAADQVCAVRALIVARLTEEFGETRQAIGLSGGSRLVELYASRETGSWTLTVTTPSGTTCILAAGENFEQVRETLGPEGDPA